MVATVADGFPKKRMGTLLGTAKRVAGSKSLCSRLEVAMDRRTTWAYRRGARFPADAGYGSSRTASVRACPSG